MTRRKPAEQFDDSTNPGEPQGPLAEGEIAGAGDALTPRRPARAPGLHDFGLGTTPKQGSILPKIARTGA